MKLDRALETLIDLKKHIENDMDWSDAGEFIDISFKTLIQDIDLQIAVIQDKIDMGEYYE